MVRAAIDRDKVKQALGRLHGAQRGIARMSGLGKREFLGRFKSIVKRLDKPLETLQDARDVLRRIPEATTHFTTCLAGFPNAGKSTVLKALTGAKAQIAAYEFTTKTLNYGTTEIGYFQVQFVDTPGTLNRVKTNSIEKQALLALKHLAKAIVFIYDPLRPADEQEELFENVLEYGVPTVIYASKQDIVPTLPLFKEAAKRKMPVFTKPAEILVWVEPMVRAQFKEVSAKENKQ
jgi:small GTP-binding protein